MKLKCYQQFHLRENSAKLYYYQKQRITVVWLRNIDVNMNQVRKALEDVDEQFKNFDHRKESNELKTRYLQEKYPLLFEQEKWHDFGTPIINFLESQLSQIINSAKSNIEHFFTFC